MKKWWRIMRLRWRIADLEAAAEYHLAQSAEHGVRYTQAMTNLRASRARLAALDCPARALRVIMGRRHG